MMSGRPPSGRRAAVGLELLVLAGRGGAVHKQELGAEQAHALRADTPARGLTSLGLPTLAAISTLAAVAGDGRALPGGLVRRCVSSHASRRAAKRRHLGLVWLQPERPGVAIDGHVLPSATCQTAWPSPTTAGIPSARARMALWAVAPPNSVQISQHALAVQPGCVRRRQVGGDEDGRRGEVERRRGDAHQAAQDALGHVLDVGSAGAHIVVGHLG
jgi:hypothetical protein